MPRLLAVSRLDGWETQWDRLVDRAPLPSPFMRSWWLTGVAGPQRRFLLAVEGGRLMGGLALDERGWPGLEVLHMMGSGRLCPDHMDLIAAPGEEEVTISLFRAWFHRPRWTLPGPGRSARPLSGGRGPTDAGPSHSICGRAMDPAARRLEGLFRRSPIPPPPEHPASFCPAGRRGRAPSIEPGTVSRPISRNAAKDARGAVGRPLSFSLTTSAGLPRPAAWEPRPTKSWSTSWQTMRQSSPLWSASRWRVV